MSEHPTTGPVDDEAERPTLPSRPGSERAPSASGELRNEIALKGCRTVEFEGETYPTLGRIVLIERIGSGGMGVVYRGINPRLRSDVAVKVLPPSALRGALRAKERFVREARIAAELESPHLVRVFDVDEDELTGAHFLVMEFVDGPSAAGWLQTSLDTHGRGVSERDALTLTLAACRGLAAAHEHGVIHRDVKPDNILIPVDADGAPLIAEAKLADLGLARWTERDEKLTATQSGLGTPGYMAPEQARRPREAVKPADVFSVGATLYALLAGRPPFEGTTPIETVLQTMNGKYPRLPTLRDSLSPATLTLVETCLKADPAERFVDAPALADALAVCLESLGDAQTDAIEAVEELTHRAERGERVTIDPDSDPADGAAPPPVTPVAAPEPPRSAAAPRAAAVAAPGERIDRAVDELIADGRGLKLGWGLIAAGVLILVVLAIALVSLLGRSDPGAPGSASAVARARLAVTSEPTGAVVTLEGKRLGVTPLQLGDLDAGDVRLDLSHPDHYATTESVSVVAGETAELSVELLRRRGRLTVLGGVAGTRMTLKPVDRTADPVSFALDASGTRREEPLPWGEYDIVAEAEHYLPVVQTARVEAGKPLVIDLQLRGQRGTIDLSQQADGVTFLYDFEPLEGVVEFRPGRVALTVERRGEFITQTVTVVVVSGETVVPVLDAWGARGAPPLVLRAMTESVLLDRKVEVAAGEERELQVTAWITTRAGGARLRSARGEVVDIESSSTVRAELLPDDTRRVELVAGALTASLPAELSVQCGHFRIDGVSTAPARVRLARTGPDGRTLSARVAEGAARIALGPQTVRLEEGQEVELTWTPRRPNSFHVSAAAKSLGTISIARLVTTGRITATVPGGSDVVVVRSDLRDETLIRHVAVGAEAGAVWVRLESAADTRAAPVNVGQEALVEHLSRRVKTAATPPDVAIGAVAIAWLDDVTAIESVRSAKADLRDARVRFVPVPMDDSERSPIEGRTADAEFEVPPGDWNVFVTSDDDLVTVRIPISVTGRLTHVVLPPAVPVGMVLVVAAPGQTPFLIDRAEVSAGEYRRFAAASGRTYANASDPEDHAAVGLTEDDCRAYARWAGKALPTRSQWLLAAFGSPDGAGTRYPWGDEAGSEGTHFFGSTTGPVSGCAAGASTFSGCVNLAGNAWEMLREGAVIGAYARGGFEMDVATDTQPWTADFLRDPLPTYARWQASSDTAWQIRHQYYSVKSAASMARVGLRCVVELN